jgi:hypothetical protein
MFASSMAIVACSSDDTGGSSSGTSGTQSSGGPGQSSGAPGSSGSESSGSGGSTKAAYGETCGLNSQCASGLCGGGRCTAFCSASQPCPNVDVCKNGVCAKS